MKVEVGDVLASDDGLFVLVLELDSVKLERWRCLVLGDFFDKSIAQPHLAGAVDSFVIQAEMPWTKVAP